jgi:hypothetical protein
MWTTLPTATGEVVEGHHVSKVTGVIGVIGKRRLDGLALIKGDMGAGWPPKCWTGRGRAAGTFALGGDLLVNRLGFGAMRLTGKGIRGEPEDPEEARRMLRRAVELGVNLIGTADSYERSRWP